MEKTTKRVWVPTLQSMATVLKVKEPMWVDGDLMPGSYLVEPDDYRLTSPQWVTTVQER